MGSVAHSDFNSEPVGSGSQKNGVLPSKGNNPKIIAINDALAKRRTTNFPNPSKPGQITVQEARIERVETKYEVEENPPYVVGEWVLPHTPCIIRGIDSGSAIKAIVYPGQKKQRVFSYRANQLVKVETIKIEDGEPEIEVVYSFDPFSNKWSIIHDGITGSLNGRLELTNDGVLHIEIDENGTCREESADGSIKLVNNCFKPKTSQFSVPEMEFLNLVSHDLRTPLMSVQGLLTLLTSGALGEIPSKALKRVNGVEIEVERLIRLVNDLLEAGLVHNQKDCLEFETIPVNELFDATVFALDGLALNKDLVIEFENSSLDVTCNVDSFIRVLVNLVANAVKYSPVGEKVILSARQEEGYVVLSVKDFGKGISESDFYRIFQSFQCGNEDDRKENSGIGLGLAICKSIMEAHGGSIGLESKPGEGSTFWVKLPD